MCIMCQYNECTQSLDFCANPCHTIRIVNQSTMNDFDFPTEEMLMDMYIDSQECEEDVHADLSGDEYADAVLSTLS